MGASHCFLAFCSLTVSTLILPTHQMIRPPLKPDVQEYVCENITQVFFCGELYPLASFPNYRDHPNIPEAVHEYNGFRPLIQGVCSNAVGHFLCSVYFPFCQVGRENLRIRPCRELCEYVRSTCESYLVDFALEWPPHLNCDNFALNSSTGLDFCPDDLLRITYPSSVITDVPFPSPTPPVTTEYTCQNITDFPICSELHDMALFPNSLGHPDQEVAYDEFANFSVLIRRGCSNAIAHFLCSIYAPPCQIGEESVPIQPCQEMCMYVQSTCEDVLINLNYSFSSWSSQWNCDNFLPSNESSVDYCPGDFSSLSIPVVTDLMPPTTTAPSTDHTPPISDFTTPATADTTPFTAPLECPSDPKVAIHN